jgi:hypothetical protein
MGKTLVFLSVLAMSPWSGTMAFDVEAGFGCWEVDPGAYNCVGSPGWEQLPNGTNSYSSQVDACYPFTSSAVDDFLGNGTGVIGVGWWGLYWNGGIGVPDAFDISIYVDAGGAPAGNPDAGGALFYEQHADYHETYETATSASYCTTFVDPFTDENGLTYWIGIQAVFCFPPQWGWATGAGDGVDVCFGFPFLGIPYWTTGASVFGVTSDMSFALLSDGMIPTGATSWSAIKNLYR